MGSSHPVDEALQAAIDSGVCPGAVLLARHRGRLVHHRAYGQAALLPSRTPARLDTIYDLASLTKPLATVTAVLCLVADGRMRLEDTVETRLPELRGTPPGSVALVHLLTHSAGLPWWRPFYEKIAEQDRATPGFLGSEQAKAWVLNEIGREGLESAPGAKSVYSDLGFILLGMIVERFTGASPPAYCRSRVYQSVGAEPLFYFRKDGTPSWGTVPRAQVAPTEQDSWRGRLLCGEVHDENAYALGGIAGHSGLFGTAQAVAAVAGAWLNAYHGRPSPLSPDWVRRFVRRQDQIPGTSWALGWDTPSVPSSSGTRFSPTSFGHLGFTGTSLWVDPERELEVVLLTNRVHPSRENQAIRQLRPALHDLIVETLEA
jgi:CubicO group peptidase (beta-lactamase class C family)